MNTAIKYGLVAGIAYILWELMEYLLGFHGPKISIGFYLAPLVVIIPVGVMILAIKARRRELKGWLPLRAGIQTAFVVSLVAALLATTFMTAYTTLINPDYLNVKVEFQRKAYFDKRKRQDPTVSDNTARREAITQFPVHGIPRIMASYGIVRLCPGLLIGLIITMWFRREPPLPGPTPAENGKPNGE